MRTPDPNKRWYFIDEAGDTNFYSRKKHRGKRRLIVGNEGCSKILLMGFIETEHAANLRRDIRNFHSALLQRTPQSAQGKNTARFLHANEDPPKIRREFFEFISTLNCKAQFVVARKSEQILLEKFNGQKDRFYDYLISCILDEKLHRYASNQIFIARRGKPRKKQLIHAIELGKKRFQDKNPKMPLTTYDVTVDHSYAEPCAWVIDYINWAVYRAYARQDMSYFEIVRNKVSYIQDIYDEERKVGNRHLYDRKTNPFHINKATPL